MRVQFSYQLAPIGMSKIQPLFMIAGLVIASSTTTPPVIAQHGGKAEPLRIEFKRGTSSTTVSGVVHGAEQAEYVISAKQGQRLIIKLSATPGKSACFDLKGPEGADVGLEYDCNYDYSKPLPVTGDYFLTVSRPSTAKGTARYRMTITIR